jgi:phosphatidylglycerol:prolipoprotein diacylglycerol transferase
LLQGRRVRSTLFYFPGEVAGWPVFGFGLALLAWGVIGLAMMALIGRREGWKTALAGYLPLWGVVAAVIVFLMPRMLEPIAGTEQVGLPIRGFGVMLLLATVAGVGLAAYRAWQVGIDPEHIYSLAFWMFGGGILGARVFYIVQYWDQFQRDSIGETLQAVLNVTQGGLVVYGSVIVGVPAGLWYLYRHGLPVLKVADVIAPSMVIGLALGRIGCFLNGCCYGGFCESMPPGMTFPAQSPPYQRQRDLGWESGIWLASAKREATTMKPLETREHAGAAADQRTSVRIAYIAPGTAAEKAGLVVGEVVTAINGQQVESLAQAQELLAAASGTYELKLADGKIARWTSS